MLYTIKPQRGCLTIKSWGVSFLYTKSEDLGCICHYWYKFWVKAYIRARIKLFRCSWRQKFVKKRGFCPRLGKFPQIMCKSFQPEVDFHSNHPLKSKSPELATFFYLTKRRFRLYRMVASVFQSLFACKQFSYSGFVRVKCVVDRYLSVTLWFMALTPKWTSLASSRPVNTDSLLASACCMMLFLTLAFISVH